MRLSSSTATPPTAPPRSPQSLGARVIESPWPGYAQQKNLAAEHAANDWILSIDADEALSEALEGEIWQIKKNGAARTTPTRCRGWRSTWADGFCIRAGIRIAKSGCTIDAKRTGLATSFMRACRSTVRVGHLESDLLHFTCDSFAEHFKTMDRYTTLAAEQIVSQGKHVGTRQLLLDPPWTFFDTYFLRRGFQDGLEGLTIAYMAALYNFVKYAKARNMAPRR